MAAVNKRSWAMGPRPTQRINCEWIKDEVVVVELLDYLVSLFY